MLRTCFRPINRKPFLNFKNVIAPLAVVGQFRYYTRNVEAIAAVWLERQASHPALRITEKHHVRSDIHDRVPVDVVAGPDRAVGRLEFALKPPSQPPSFVVYQGTGERMSASIPSGLTAASRTEARASVRILS